MEYTSRSISQSVKSGEYFKEAREWYIQSYVQVHTQRLFVILAAVLALGFSAMIFGVTMGGYFTEKYPFPMYFDGQLDSFMQVTPLSRGVESVNTSVARYLLSKYVQDREGYDPVSLNSGEWEKKIQRVKAVSSRSVFSDYSTAVDPSNEDSPIIRYKLQTTRAISVDKVVLQEHLGVPISALIYYHATEIGSDSQPSTKWVADVRFSMTNIVHKLKQKIKLQFTVTKYNVEQVE